MLNECEDSLNIDVSAPINLQPTSTDFEQISNDDHNDSPGGFTEELINIVDKQ